jgi:hypothetical protein
MSAAVAVCFSATAADPSYTTSTDSTAKPCFKKRGDAKRKFRWAGHTYPPTPIRYCPLWRDRVPVRASRSGRAPIVGYLNLGGTANWFVYQMRGDRQTLPTSPPVWNRWWASTKADNGRWGWVNEVFFSGGDNGEPDRGLTGPPGKWVCVAPCPPIPPWAT